MKKILTLLFITLPISLTAFAFLYKGTPITDPKDPAFQSAAALLIEGRFTCTGTVISEKHVLTAAHCIEGREYSKGSVVFGQNIESRSRHVRPIQWAVAMPEYYRENRPKWDVAILGFDGGIPKGHRAARFASHEEGFKKGKQFSIAGYGQQGYGGSTGFLNASGFTVDFKDSAEFSATSNWGGSSACYGDSGGPWYLQDGPQMFLLGLSSQLVLTGQRPCHAGQFAVSPNLFSGPVREFVKKHTGIVY